MTPTEFVSWAGRQLRPWTHWLDRVGFSARERVWNKADPARADLIRQRHLASKRHRPTREIEAELRKATLASLRAGIGRAA